MNQFGEVRAVGFHPRGVECVRFGWGKIFSSGLDETIQAWDPSRGKVWNTLRDASTLQSLAANGNMIAGLHALTLETLEDSGQIACGLSKGPITILDATNGRPIHMLEFEAEPLHKSTGFCSLAISSDGQWIAGTNRTYAAVWSLSDANLLWRSPKRAGGNSVLFAGAAQSLLVQGTAAPLRMTHWRSQGPLMGLPIAKLGGQLISVRAAPAGAGVDFAVSILDLKDAPPPLPAARPVLAKPVPAPAPKPEPSDDDLEVDMDGTWTGEFAGPATVMKPMPKVPEAAPPSVVEDDEEPAAGPSLGDAGYLVGIRLTDAAVAWKSKTTGRVQSVCFVPGGKYLITGSTQGRIEMWQSATGMRVGFLDISAAPVMREAGTDYVEGTTAVPWLEEDFFPAYAVQSLALSSDGTQLAIGTCGGAVLVTSVKYD